MKEKYSLYEFEVYSEKLNDDTAEWLKINDIPVTDLVWVYKIYCDRDYLNQCRDIESDEWFETEQEARFAAVGHIDKLENGEG